MDISLIINWIDLSFCLVAIFLGIWITMRVAGKLKCAVGALLIVVIVHLIYTISNIFYFLTPSAHEIFESIIHLITIALILFAAFCMKKMINKIDGHYKKK